MSRSKSTKTKSVSDDFVDLESGLAQHQGSTCHNHRYRGPREDETTHVAGAPADRAGPVSLSTHNRSYGPSSHVRSHSPQSKSLEPSPRFLLRKTRSGHQSNFSESECETDDMTNHEVACTDEESEDHTEHDALLDKGIYSSSYGGTVYFPQKHQRRRHRLGSISSVSNVSGSTSGNFGANRSHYIDINTPHITNSLKNSESILRLAGLIDNDAGKFEHYRKSPDELEEMSPKVRAFYEEQNETLDTFAEIDKLLDNVRADIGSMHYGTVIPPVPSENDSIKGQPFDIQACVNLNFFINFLLLLGKVLAVLLSHSVSVTASAVDSFMDFLSTFIITGTSWFQNSNDWRAVYEYPVGRNRMEPIGIVIFSVFMISSFVQVLIESLQRLFSKELEQTTVPPIGVVVMISTITIKLGLWLWMRGIKNASVEALTQDAENDIVFNFFSLIFPLVGSFFNIKQLDAIGGALLSVYIIAEWVGTLFENVHALSGKRASPNEYNRACYLLTRFSKIIVAIQHLHVYQTGGGVIIEVDVVVPANTALSLAHNVAESAQYALEELDGVQRAFVHVDVSINPLSGHIVK